VKRNWLIARGQCALKPRWGLCDTGWEYDATMGENRILCDGSGANQPRPLIFLGSFSFVQVERGNIEYSDRTSIL